MFMVSPGGTARQAGDRMGGSRQVSPGKAPYNFLKFSYELKTSEE
jgi:hypothetical protein